MVICPFLGLVKSLQQEFEQQLQDRWLLKTGQYPRSGAPGKQGLADFCANTIHKYVDQISIEHNISCSIGNMQTTCYVISQEHQCV